MEKKQSYLRRLSNKVRGFFVGPVSSDISILGGDPNALDFGVTVTKDAALRFTAVFAAIKILSENIASLPKSVVRKLKDGGYEDATDHPAFNLLSREPNGYTDIFSFWFGMLSYLLSKGNAYAVIESKNGRPAALHHIPSEYVYIKFINGEKLFVVNCPDPNFSWLNGTYLADDMIHLMYYTQDGIHGIDPITYNAAAIGRGIATQKFSAEFYSKGGNIKGTLETDQSLGDDAYENFMKHYNAASANFETPLLEYGIKYKSIGISPIAAQLIQSETLSIQDIARIYSIPPHLLAEMSHATFSNIEAQNIYFSTYSLRPLCKRIEQQLENKLLLPRERSEYGIKFDLRGMMRGDDSARSAYYASGINAGWLTPNEARTLEGMSALPGLDSPRVPLNTGIVDEAGKIINPNTTQE